MTNANSRIYVIAISINRAADTSGTTWGRGVMRCRFLLINNAFIMITAVRKLNIIFDNIIMRSRSIVRSGDVGTTSLELLFVNVSLTLF